LPPLESDKWWTSLSFGYDHFIDNYKVIVVVSFKNEVFVYTLGTDYWTRIQDMPYSNPIYGEGLFVSGTVNWPARDGSNNSLYFILSLDLKNESYHALYLPADFKNDPYSSKLDVVRDCLCVFETSDMFFNVWIMKEYGKKESWTKLFTIPNLQDQDLEADTALYISEDDQLLVECYEMSSGKMKLVVYNSKTGTLNIPEFQNNYDQMFPIVYIESLISP
jgi:F-box interacting protein